MTKLSHQSPLWDIEVYGQESELRLDVINKTPSTFFIYAEVKGDEIAINGSNQEHSYTSVTGNSATTLRFTLQKRPRVSKLQEQLEINIEYSRMDKHIEEEKLRKHIATLTPTVKFSADDETA